MIASYRDPRYAASIRIEELRERLHDLPEGVPEELTRVYSRRVARISAGAVAMAGFVAVVGASIANIHGDVHATPFLAASVGLSLAVYFIVRLVASLTFARRVWSALDEGQDELSRLARLEEDSVRRAAVRLASVDERVSLAVPMAGISLLAPLAIHLGVWCVTGSSEPNIERWLSEFDWWIAASLILVGLGHGVLAFLCFRFARRVAEAPILSLSEKNPMRGWSALGWTVLASCVPGIIAFAIPVVIVFATGILFIPAMFHVMYRRALQERHALGAD